MWAPWKKKPPAFPASTKRVAPDTRYTQEPGPKAEQDPLADPGIPERERMPADVAHEVQEHLQALDALSAAQEGKAEPKLYPCLTASLQMPLATAPDADTAPVPSPREELSLRLGTQPVHESGPAVPAIEYPALADSATESSTKDLAAEHAAGGADMTSAGPKDATVAELPVSAKPKRLGLLSSKGVSSIRSAWTRLLDKVNPSRLLERNVRTDALPIRVLMGYLPEVTARDAREYAQGIAEKHFEQMGLVFFGAFEYANGYVYEVHEGGAGKAFAPEILAYFEEQGPFIPGEEHKVYLRTSTRVLEVLRQRDGLVAILLPESAPVRHSEWLTAAKALTPAMDRREKVLYVGSAIFASGVVAMVLSGLFFRLQPIEAPVPPAPSVVTAATLPLSQWSRVQAVPADAYVRSVRYRNGRWEAPEIQTVELSLPALPVTSDAATVPPLASTPPPAPAPPQLSAPSQ